ncbi:MAG: hypothetical protein IT448_08205 [Phycisphaerales bacterium]|nr:hypothetical protein [Phycisphaerales bacterium]
MKFTTTTTTLLISLAGIATTIGCSSNKAHEQQTQCPTAESFFQDEQEQRSTAHVLLSQQNRGAAADAMLYAAHFDGDQLNSLGQDKLDKIIAGTSIHSPVTVYLNLPEADQYADARQQSVSAYLGDHGVASDRIAVNPGVNESNTHLASFGTASIYQSEGGHIGSTESKLTSSTSGADSTGISRNIQPTLGQP